MKAGLRPRIAARLAGTEQRLAELTAFATSLQAALEHLDALPGRAGRCGVECGFPAPSHAAHPADVVLSPSRQAAARDAERWRTVPVACSLTGDGVPRRIAAWRDATRGAHRAEIPGGLRLTVPAGRAAAIAGLAAAEQQCCPFFGFRLHLDGPSLHVEVRAPAEGASVLAALFGPAT